MDIANMIVRIELIVYFSLILLGCNAIPWIQEPHFFTVHLDNHTWNEAREYCRSSSDQLISILDETELKFWTEILNHTFLNKHRGSDSVYWTGLHAPDTNLPNSYFLEDCSTSTLFEPAYNTLTANYQCMAMNGRDFSNLEFERTMCNHTYPFICSTYLNNSECVGSCDDLVVLTTKDVCDEFCKTSDCFTIYLNQMQMCHVIPKENTSSTRFTICYLPSEDLTPNICGEISENITIDIEDYNIAVSDTSCAHIHQNRSYTNTTIDENCECLCEKLWTFLQAPLPEAVNLTIEEKIELIVNELTVDKRNTTSSLRKYVSVMDYRPSSIGIGIVAGAIIIAVIGVIILIDLSSIWCEIHSYFLSFLRMFSSLHKSRNGNQSNFNDAGTIERNPLTNNDESTDAVTSIGWFSRESGLCKDADAEYTSDLINIHVLNKDISEHTTEISEI